MKQVGQTVDDRHAAELCQILDETVAERPAHGRVDPALEVFPDVLDRLAHPDLPVGGRVVDRVAPELRHARLEGHAGPQRRLLEVHEERAPGQRVTVLGGIRLDVLGQRQDSLQLVGSEIQQGDQIASGQARAVHRVLQRDEPARV